MEPGLVRKACPRVFAMHVETNLWLHLGHVYCQDIELSPNLPLDPTLPPPAMSYRPLKEEPDAASDQQELGSVAKRAKLDEPEDPAAQELGVDDVAGASATGGQEMEEEGLLAVDEEGRTEQRSDRAVASPSVMVLESEEDARVFYDAAGGSSADEGVDDDETLLVKSDGEQVEEKVKQVKVAVATRLVRWSLLLCVCFTIPILIVAASVIIGLNHTCPLLSPLPWWKTAVTYQIYPQSFQDTSGNGVGDLQGIVKRVDYLKYLGVKAVWLNPIYPSPQADAGYDVSNYTDINPLYGSMDGFRQLLDALHEQGIKLIMDFVPNHTSEEHPWFKESCSSRNNPKRDWYVWADPAKDGGPPNNWISVFGGSMWEYSTTTNQYYLHQFSKQQPDLNLTNSMVLDALDSVLRFWLDVGVDGFRVDAVPHFLEDRQLRDEPPVCNASADNASNLTYDALDHIYTKNVEGIHSITRRWRKLVDGYKDRVLIGEIYGSPEVVMSYYGTDSEPEFHYPFNFLLLENTNWTGIGVSEIIDRWLREPSKPTWGWPNWVLGNHDNPRMASKVGPELARALNVLLLLLPGTPTTYFGEELGLENVPVPPDQQKDTNTDNPRDGERTPMLWDNTTNAGFSSAKQTWLPVANQSVVEHYSVEAQKADTRSMLQLYRRLVRLRESSPAFTNDGYYKVAATDESLVFLRYYKEGLKLSDERFAVAINFSPNSTAVSADVSEFVDQATFVLSSRLDGSGSAMVATKAVALRPYEAVVLRGKSDYWI